MGLENLQKVFRIFVDSFFRAKAIMQKPQGKSKLLVQIPGVQGWMVVDKIDTCIMHNKTWKMLKLISLVAYESKKQPIASSSDHHIVKLTCLNSVSLAINFSISVCFA